MLEEVTPNLPNEVPLLNALEREADAAAAAAGSVDDPPVGSTLPENKTELFFTSEIVMY